MMSPWRKLVSTKTDLLSGCGDVLRGFVWSSSAMWPGNPASSSLLPRLNGISTVSCGKWLLLVEAIYVTWHVARLNTDIGFL